VYKELTKRFQVQTIGHTQSRYIDLSVLEDQFFFVLKVTSEYRLDCISNIFFNIIILITLALCLLEHESETKNTNVHHIIVSMRFYGIH
jgi:hypothetical protein